MTSRGIGILQIVVSGVGFGLLGLAGKATAARGITTGEHLALRFLIASLVLTLYLLIFDRRALAFSKRTAAKCVGLGAFGYALFSTWYFTALSGLSASLTVLLLYTYPVIVTVFGRLFLKQALPPRGLLALASVSFGLILLVGTEISVRDARFVAFGLGSAALYSAYILVSSRVLKGVSPIAAVALIQASAGIMLAALNFHDAERVIVVCKDAWWLIGGTAIFTTAAPMVLFICGLMRLTAAEVSMLSTVEPLTGVVAAMSILHERMTLMQGVGGALILAALFVLSMTPKHRTT